MGISKWANTNTVKRLAKALISGLMVTSIRASSKTERNMATESGNSRVRAVKRPNQFMKESTKMI